MKKIYRVEAGEIKDQYGNEPSTGQILDALNGESRIHEGDGPATKFTFMVEAESEADLLTYTQALKREVAMWDFEQDLRMMWKHDENVDHETVDKIWELWHQHKGGLAES